MDKIENFVKPLGYEIINKIRGLNINIIIAIVSVILFIIFFLICNCCIQCNEVTDKITNYDEEKQALIKNKEIKEKKKKKVSFMITTNK